MVVLIHLEIHGGPMCVCACLCVFVLRTQGEFHPALRRVGEEEW